MVFVYPAPFTKLSLVECCTTVLPHESAPGAALKLYYNTPLMSDKHLNFDLVINSQQLRALAEDLNRQPRIAVDTESNSLYAYREQVCLIQFSTPQRDALVDPLALDDLSPLAPVFANPQVEKLFHAAEYDLLTLRRDFNYEFNNIFDTMVAVRVLGREKVGLGSVLEQEFGIVLEKKYQRANWGRRPLPKAMLDYARLDTHYLIPLRQKLHHELVQKQRLELAQEDFARLCCLNGNGPEPGLPSIWRMRGVKDLTPKQASILQRLVEYRQQQARQADLPLFKMFSDKTLVEIAAAEPRSKANLASIYGLTPNKLHRHARGLLQAVRQGLEDEPAYRPRRPRLPDEQIERLETLRLWRKTRAREMGVESDIVLPRDIMERIARKNPSRSQELHDLLEEIPWRRERFSGEIADVLNIYQN